MNAVEELNRAGIERRRDLRAGAAGNHRFEESLEALVAATKRRAGTYLRTRCFLSLLGRGFLPFLEKEFPALVKQYQERYTSRAFVSEGYHRDLSKRMAKLRENTRSTSSENRAGTRKRTVLPPRACPPVQATAPPSHFAGTVGHPAAAADSSRWVPLRQSVRQFSWQLLPPDT